MPAEENKALSQRAYEQIFNRGNLDQIEEFVSADLVDHETPPPGMEGLEGIEVLRQFVKVFRDAFPDLRFTAEDIIAEGDKVAARYTMRGTHHGEFMGVAPTGNRIEVTGIDIVRFEVARWRSTGPTAMSWA
jgi:predicted ester cyclase